MNFLKNSPRWPLSSHRFIYTKVFLVLCILLRNQSSVFGIPDPAWCSLPPNYSIPAGQTAKISVLIPGSTISTGKVFFLGSGATLEVDKTFLFNNCYFICGAGAKINVVTSSNSNATKCFSFSSKYFSCTSMWEGITVMPGNTIDFRGNRIYDAVKAINFPPQYNNVSNRLTDNLFENNQYGLFIGLRPSPFSANVGFVRCYGNTFLGTQILLNNQSLPDAGAFITQNSSLQFGTTGGLKNTFKSMRNGIVIVRGSFASIAHSDFNNLIDEGAANPTDGAGVIVNGSSATITQVGSSRCRFEENGFAGVYVDGARGLVNVDGADFIGAQPYGIRYDLTNQNTYLTFSNNTFNLVENKCISAIKVIRPPANSLIPNSEITQNVINYPQSNTISTFDLETFIRIDGIYGANNRFNITGNTINNNSRHKMAHGIYIAGTGDNYFVSGNQIYYMAPESQLSTGHSCLGIVFDALSGEGNEVRFNYITSRLRTIGTNVDLDDKSYIKCAIHVHNCNRPVIACNSTEDTYRGIHFSESNPGTTFAENFMNRHVFGVEFRKNTGGGPNTNIEDQNWRLNQWRNSSGSYINGGVGARYHDDPSVPFVFRVNPGVSAPSPYAYIPPSAVPGVATWFKPETGATYPLCGLFYAEPPVFNYTDAEVLISKNQYPYQTTVEGWDARRRLWYNITRHPLEVSQQSDIQSFSTTTWGSSAQRFGNALFQYEQAFIPNNQIAGQLANYYQQEKGLLDDIKALAAQIAQDTAVIDSMALFSLQGKWNSLRAVQNDILSTHESYSTTLTNNLVNLTSLVNALPSDQLWEQGWKTILQTGIRWTQSDSFSMADRTALIDIANTCGADIGLARSAVLPFMPARDAAPFLGTETDNGCLSPAKDRSFSQTISAPGLLIYPNPASDVLNVQLPADNGGWIEIYDLTGRSLRSQSVSNQEFLSLDIQGLSTGMFWLRFIARNGSVYSAKFLIEKN